MGTQLIVGGTGNSPSTSAKNYMGLSDCGGATWQATEANTGGLVSCGGTLQKLRIVGDVAPGTSKSYVYTVFKNGSSTALTVTISGNSATTGQDSADTVSVVAGDRITLEANPVSTPSPPTNLRWSLQFAATNTGDTTYMMGSTTAIATGTVFIGPCGCTAASNLSALNANAQVVCPIAGTIKNLYALLDTAPGGAASRTFTLVKNGSTTALAVTISAGSTTGNDTSHNISVSAGDTLSIQCSSASSPANSLIHLGIVITATTDGECAIMANPHSTTSASATQYVRPGSAQGASWSATESTRQICMQAATVKALYAVLGTTTGASPKQYTFTVRKNSGGTALTCAIVNATTGNDVTHSFTVANDDLVSLELAPANTPNTSSTTPFGFCVVLNVNTTTVQTITGHSRMQVTTTKTITGKGRTQKTVLQTITGVARMQKTVLQTISGKAREQKTVQQAITGKANILGTTQKQITGKSEIRKTVLKTISGKAREQVTSQQLISGKARVQKSVAQNISGKADVLNTTQKQISGKARLQKSVQQTLSGKADMQVTTQKQISGKGRIRKTVPQTISGKARAQKTVQQPISGKGRVTNSAQQAISGKGRIEKTLTKDITGKAKMVVTITTTKQITGKGRLQKSVTQDVQGKANVKITQQKNITGRSNISVHVQQLITGTARLITPITLGLLDFPLQFTARNIALVCTQLGFNPVIIPRKFSGRLRTSKVTWHEDVYTEVAARMAVVKKADGYNTTLDPKNIYQHYDSEFDTLIQRKNFPKVLLMGDAGRRVPMASGQNERSLDMLITAVFRKTASNDKNPVDAMLDFIEDMDNVINRDTSLGGTVDFASLSEFHIDNSYDKPEVLGIFKLKVTQLTVS